MVCVCAVCGKANEEKLILLWELIGVANSQHQSDLVTANAKCSDC